MVAHFAVCPHHMLGNADMSSSPPDCCLQKWRSHQHVSCSDQHSLAWTLVEEHELAMLGYWIAPIDNAPAVRSCKKQRHWGANLHADWQGVRNDHATKHPMSLSCGCAPTTVTTATKKRTSACLEVHGCFSTVSKPTCCLKGLCKGSIAHSRGPQDIAGDLHIRAEVGAVHLDFIGGQLGQGASQAVPCSHSQEQQWVS